MAIKIHSIRTQRINLALTRPLRMSFGEISQQHLLLVRTIDTDGVEGIGEACVMGGPYWNGETIEGTQATVERYASPHLVGQNFDSLADYSAALHRIFRGNGAARTALEMSFLDLVGKKTNMRAVDLLGGPQRTSIPVAWTIPSGDVSEAIDDGERAIEARGHRLFKLKVGIYDTEREVDYARSIVRQFEGRARLLIDANQAWSEHDAPAILNRFHDVGVAVVEQPISGHDAQAMARLVQDCPIAILADEPLTGPATAALMAKSQSASGFVVKPQRDGGLMDALTTARSASEAGLSCYGGTMLETSLGTAALVALYATVSDLTWGSELFGPLRLDDDITVDALVPIGGDLPIPTGPGLGVTLDEERVRRLEEKCRA